MRHTDIPSLYVICGGAGEGVTCESCCLCPIRAADSLNRGCALGFFRRVNVSFLCFAIILPKPIHIFDTDISCQVVQ